MTIRQLDKVRGIQQFAEAQHCGRIRYKHIKAHDNEPWNEMADVVAKTAAGILQPNRSGNLAKPPHDLWKTVISIDWKWAWLHFAERNQPKGPALRYGSLCWPPVEGSSSLCPGDLIPCELGLWKGAQVVKMSIRALSANVQSIKGKEKLIEQQLLEGQYDVAFFQETKVPDGYLETDSFVRMLSRNDVHWGTAIWVRKNLQINGKTVQLQRSDLTIRVENSRLIVVDLRKDDIRLCLASVHLPHQSRPIQERPDVLDIIERELGSLQSDYVVIMGIDANVRVPQDRRPAV